MEKNPNSKLIIFILVSILILGFIIFWFTLQEKKSSHEKKEELSKEEKVIEEIFNLTAVVSSIDVKRNFLIVKTIAEEKEIKVMPNEETKLLKLELPFDPKNPPQKATFTPKETEIELSGFQEGNFIFIKANQNIAGKDELNDVDLIRILP